MPAFSRTLALLAFATLAPSVSMAQGGAMDECRKLIGRVAIAPCTLAIDDQKESPANRADAYLLRARAALDISDLEKAEADLAAGLGLRPNNPFGYRLRGRLRGLQGRNADARADYTKALQISDTPPGKYVSYLNRGQFFVRIKELTEALADFDAAIHLHGAKAQAHVG